MIPDPWRKRKQCSPSRRSFQVEQPQAVPNGFSRITSHETRLLCFPTHDFPAFPGPPPPRAKVRAPFASATRPVGFSRVTKHGIYCPSVLRGAQESHNRKPPPGTYVPAARLLLSCALWRLGERLGSGWSGMEHLSRLPRSVNRSRWASRGAPFTENPVKMHKIPLLPGKCVKHSVRLGSRFPPGWVPLRPTQNEPMLNKRNVLCRVDSAGRSLPLGPRALYIECGSGACQGSLDASFFSARARIIQAGNIRAAVNAACSGGCFRSG